MNFIRNTTMVALILFCFQSQGMNKEKPTQSKHSALYISLTPQGQKMLQIFEQSMPHLLKGYKDLKLDSQKALLLYTINEYVDLPDEREKGFKGIIEAINLFLSNTCFRKQYSQSVLTGVAQLPEFLKDGHQSPEKYLVAKYFLAKQTPIQIQPQKYDQADIDAWLESEAKAPKISGKQPNISRKKKPKGRPSARPDTTSKPSPENKICFTPIKSVVAPMQVLEAHDDGQGEWLCLTNKKGHPQRPVPQLREAQSKQEKRMPSPRADEKANAGIQCKNTEQPSKDPLTSSWAEVVTGSMEGSIARSSHDEIQVKSAYAAQLNNRVNELAENKTPIKTGTISPTIVLPLQDYKQMIMLRDYMQYVQENSSFYMELFKHTNELLTHTLNNQATYIEYQDQVIKFLSGCEPVYFGSEPIESTVALEAPYDFSVPQIKQHGDNVLVVIFAEEFKILTEAIQNLKKNIDSNQDKTAFYGSDNQILQNLVNNQKIVIANQQHTISVLLAMRTHQ